MIDILTRVFGRPRPARRLDAIREYVQLALMLYGEDSYAYTVGENILTLVDGGEL